MPIDIKREITAGFFLRWMSVRNMKNALNKLNDTDLLFPNIVGNLTVTDKDGIKSSGFIDFNGEEYILFDEIMES